MGERFTEKSEPQAPRSYLNHLVDSGLSLFVHNDKTRNEWDGYVTGGLTTFSLFAPGWTGRIATALTYGLNQASPDEAVGAQLADGLLGAAKGAGLRYLYGTLSQKISFAPTKGVVMGVASRALDTLAQRNTFSNPGQTLEQLKAQTLNPQSWLFDAAVWTAGEGAFAGANRLSGGALAQSRLLSGAAMGGTFGVISGGAAEIQRQQKSGQALDWGTVVRKGLIEGSIDAVAAGAGTAAGRAQLPVDESRRSGGSDKTPEGDAQLHAKLADLKRVQALVIDRQAGVVANVTDARPADLGDLQALAQARAGRHAWGDRTFPAAGRLDIIGSDGFRVPKIMDRIPISRLRNRLYADAFEVDGGGTTITLMAPLAVGDPHDINSEASKAAWDKLDKDLAAAKSLGVNGISTDVWWGLIEPAEGKFDWSYYDKLADHITRAGLQWTPILSFHQAGGNVGDDVYIPLPDWVFTKVAAKAGKNDAQDVQFVSEQGNASKEYISFWATQHALDNYASVMREFQNHFAAKAPNIAEINVSLGPSGELRYPSYNSHDKNVGYPSRGALQAYSTLARESFRQAMLDKYGGIDGVRKAWNLPDLTEEQINPPSDPNSFYQRGDHLNLQYGRDFFDWYNDTLINHGRTMLGTAFKIFGDRAAPFYGKDIGAKNPGVHWMIGHYVGNRLVLGPRLAELDAGLLRTSNPASFRVDANGNVDSGYGPIYSMYREFKPLHDGLGNRIVPSFTAIELADGQDGAQAQSLPHTLATWIGREAYKQGLPLKGENALSGTLYNAYNWDLMKSLLALPGHPGFYHGLTLLRMSDVVNNSTATGKLSEIINDIHSGNQSQPKQTETASPADAQPAGSDKKPAA